MRKIIYVIGTLLVLLVVAAGCNTQKSSSPAANQPAPQTNQTPTQTTVAKGDSDLGKKVFDLKCSGCHATDNSTTVGPGLKGIYSKDKLVDGKAVNDANILELIKSGSGRMPGNPSLGESDCTNLITYLKTLK
jgi:cytochrome c5